MSLTIGLELGLGLGASLVSLLGVEAWRRLAHASGMLDMPNARSSHCQPTPRGGGFLFPLAVIAVIVLSASVRETWGDTAVAGVALSVLLVALVSLWDDVRIISTPVKLAVHVLAASVGVVAIGYPTVVWLPGIGLVDIGPAGAPLAVLWIVGLTNAYNFMDGIDGIAGLQAMFAGIGWLVIGSITGTPAVGVLGALLAGVSLGFLAHNWPPASVFMGDVGSASLGFAFAIMTLMAGGFNVRLLVVGVVLLWPFLFDTLFTFSCRLQQGKPVFSAHRTHFYQRLVIAGYTHRAVTCAYGLLAAVGLLCAWMLTVGSSAVGGMAISILGLSALTLWRAVERAEQFAARAQ